MKNKISLLHFVLVTSLFYVSQASAQTFIVNTETDFVDKSPGDGICNTEFDTCSLRAAIQEANLLNGRDTITIPAGTYKVDYGAADEDKNLEGDLDILEYVEIVGAGADKTILDGANKFRIFDIKRQPYSSSAALYNKPWTQISNVTIQNGKSSMGGGIRSEDALYLSHVTIANNQAATDISYNTASGGGLALIGYSQTKLDISASTFSNNVASGNGGAIYSQSSSSDSYKYVRIEDSIIQNNSAENGGGVYGWLGMNRVKLDGNSANTNGGGMYGVGTMMDIIIAGNTAVNGSGGGIYLLSTSIVKNALIDNNSAPKGLGGGIYLSSNCCSTVYTTDIANTTIANNSAGNGGGVYVAKPPYSYDVPMKVELTNATVVSNSATNVSTSAVGGNISGPARMKNSIVALPVAGANCEEVVTSLGFNIEDTNTCGLTSIKDKVNTDPLLDAVLADNGGFSNTFSLMQNSPAIDAGSATFCPVIDQRWFGRIDGKCDIGAYEMSAVLYKPGVIQFKEATTTVQEDVGNSHVWLTRTGGSDGKVTVKYTVATGYDYQTSASLMSANSGSLYYADAIVSLAGEVTWENGDTADKSIDFTVVDDTYVEASEFFTITLTEITTPAVWPNEITSTVTITDNDVVNTPNPSPTPMPGFSGYLNYNMPSSISEASGGVDISFGRDSGVTGVASLTYVIEDDTAIRDVDYSADAYESTLSWKDGSSGVKTIHLNIVNDEVYTGSRTFSITIKDVAGFYNASQEPKIWTITINEDEEGAPGRVVFESRTYKFFENEGTVEILLRRIDGSDGRLSVEIQDTFPEYLYTPFFGGSATKDKDYSIPSDPVVFANGETEKTFFVEIKDDNIKEADEIFFLYINTLSAYPTFDQDTLAEVTIDDSNEGGDASLESADNNKDGDSNAQDTANKQATSSIAPTNSGSGKSGFFGATDLISLMPFFVLFLLGVWRNRKFAYSQP